ncbi:hypothetical protein [Kribbella sp. NBC_00359]|uniref:hypothetical protein n=1 Tax=Kribbella sp. NBC_00359 TaxID=2975966 RepID=UPI002E1DA96F
MNYYEEAPAGGYASARDLARLDSRVSSEIRDLEEQVSTVSSSVSGVEETTFRLSADVDELKETTADEIADLTSTVERQDALIGRLVRQFAWLEQHATFTTGRAAKLDQATPPMKRWATAARTYEAMVSQLLTESQIEQRRREIKAWEAWLAKQDNLETEVIAAAKAALRGVSAVPADGGPVGRARVESLAKEKATHARNRSWLESQARQARTAIADHEALMKQFGSTLTTGKTARTKLTAEVRTRIESMLAEPDELPPLWFSLTLGQRPPAGQRAAWLAAAEALVLYRVMYDVNHQVNALGPDTVTDAVQKRLRNRAAGLLKQFATT